MKVTGFTGSQSTFMKFVGDAFSRHTAHLEHHTWMLIPTELPIRFSRVCCTNKISERLQAGHDGIRGESYWFVANAISAY